jgi:hypothetical protein
VKDDKRVEVLQSDVDSKKRDFMKKFGTYAATAPLGMYMLMTPSTSAAVQSGSSTRVKGNNGWGNGDQRAPGRSLNVNQAENTVGGKTQRVHGNSNAN